MTSRLDTGFRCAYVGVMSIAAEMKKKVWTEAELETLPGDGYLHEVVNGELVVSPKSNWLPGEIYARLIAPLKIFADAHRLGAVWDSSTGFWMKNLNGRAPDISFVGKPGFEYLVADLFKEWEW